MMTLYKTTLKIVSFFLLVFFTNSSFASDSTFKASAQLNTNYIKIGDQATLTLRSESPVDRKVNFPALSDTLNTHIQVVSKSKIDTTFSNNKKQVILTQNILITAFDSGYFAIAPFRFIMDKDSENAISTEPLLLQVQTVPVDTTQAIKDIKGPKDAPWSFREWIPYFLWTAFGILIGLLVFYWIKKRKTKQVVVQVRKPDIPPHVYALEQLRALQEERLWQSGQYKLYQIQLSDIVRSYINARFKINAMEQTSDETMRSLRGIHMEDDTKLKLRQLLMLSDMVKFAKEEPLASENEKSMQDAIDFIMATANTRAEQERKEDLK